MLQLFNKCSFITRGFVNSKRLSTAVPSLLVDDLLTKDDIKYNDLPFDQVYRLSKDFIALSKSSIGYRDLSDRFAKILLDYVQGKSKDDTPLTANECLLLFEAQISTQSDKYITLFASQIFTLIRKNSTDGKLSPEDLEVAVKTLVRLRQLKIIYMELLDYVSNNAASLTVPLLVDFTVICHHNGLRAKHHLDIAYKFCRDRLEEFSFPQLMTILKCFSYFSYEYKDIFLSSQDLIKGNLAGLLKEDMIMILNVCKTLHKEHHFHNLRDSILNHLLDTFNSLTLRFHLRCIAQLSRGKKSIIGSRYISMVLQDVEEVKKELYSCTVVQLSEIMSCINFWKIRMNNLTSILDHLAERIVDVVNAKNLGIWAEIYNTIYNTGWFSLDFMNAGIKHIIADPQVLSRVSTHQVVRVLQTFYKLRYFHRESYMNMLRVIDDDFDSLKPKLNVISEVVLAAADGNIEMDSLYNKSLEHLSSTLSNLELHTCEEPIHVMEKNNIWGRNIITASWGFAVMGFNKDSRFITLLQNMLLPQIVGLNHPLNIILMALELSEATLISGIEPALCQELLECYGEELRKLESQATPMRGGSFDFDDNMRDHTDGKMNFTQSQDIHFHKGRMRATKHISDILYHLGRRDVLLRVAPHYNSPYVIDICFSRESKKGIILFSGRELLRNHIDGKWSIIDTGSSRIKRFILQNTGWNVVEISCGEWAQLSTPISRKQYVKNVLEKLDITK